MLKGILMGQGQKHIVDSRNISVIAIRTGCSIRLHFSWRHLFILLDLILDSSAMPIFLDQGHNENQRKEPKTSFVPAFQAVSASLSVNSNSGLVA
jgi:hypothetical protein